MENNVAYMILGLPGGYPHPMYDFVFCYHD